MNLEKFSAVNYYINLFCRYALMLKCWEMDVKARLSFNDVTEQLGKANGNYEDEKLNK